MFGRMEPNKIFVGYISQVVDEKYRYILDQFTDTSRVLLTRKVRKTLLYERKDSSFSFSKTYIDLSTGEKYGALNDFSNVGDLVVDTRTLVPLYVVMDELNADYPTKKVSTKQLVKIMKNAGNK